MGDAAAEGPEPQPIRVREFFSGIGGMRLGLPEGLPVSSVIALDTSPVANTAYRHNFGEAPQQRLVEHVKPSEVDGAADLWLMSPPCQPFTVTAHSKQLDAGDLRCNGLKAMIDLLRALSNPPRWLFLENVRGFLGSEMGNLYTEALREAGYSWRTWLLTPRQLGFPNNRLRCYVAAERSGRFAAEAAAGSVCVAPAGEPPAIRPISDFVDASLSGAALEALLVPLRSLAKPWAQGLSVAGLQERASYCFTRGYGKVMHRSSGSLLLAGCDRELLKEPLDRSDMPSYHGRLRFFSDREMLGLMGFPPTYSFPESMGMVHRRRLVGNSVSVAAVRCVLEDLLCRAGGPPPTVVPLAEVLSGSWHHPCAGVGDLGALGGGDPDGDDDAGDEAASDPEGD
eukprot:TRINITY_DN65131_c0_g1_i1.p1 TRINITY_DN65131_c0_g1~~TRINITY_DN65131_c0_g1_i1.p1  ORF type:complete len:431 (+),score=121.25 TRINITY_DN65131_c0_g1_i1:103-1293(+)